MPSSFVIGNFEVQQSGSSQVTSAFADGCVSTQAVSLDPVLVLVLEDVALPSFLIANLIPPRFVFPLSPTFSSNLLFSASIALSQTTETLSSASLEVSLRPEVFFLALVGFGDGSVEQQIQSISTRQKPFSLVTFSSASELGERLRFSSPELLVFKPFQSYYRRAREGRSVQLDESLFVETMAAMRTDIVGEIKSLQSSMMEDPSKAISMKAVVKQTSLARGFLRRGFLNWSVQPTLA